MRSTMLVAAVLFAAHTSALAADPAPVSIGDEVLPKFGAVLKDGDETIGVITLASPWTVHKIDGEWLWVGNKRKVWVQRSDVVTLDEASAYYTQVIDSGQNTEILQ